MLEARQRAYCCRILSGASLRRSQIVSAAVDKGRLGSAVMRAGKPRTVEMITTRREALYVLPEPKMP